jgi:uncharacterized membrane protein YfcA
MEPLGLPTYGILGLVGFVAGFVDSIAGGGGIITIPALLSAGLPPHLALGTNKLQSSFGSLTASLTYRHHGLVRVRQTLLGVLFTAIGAAAGTLTIQRIPPTFLRQAIPILLVAIFVYTLLSPRLGERHGPARLSSPIFHLIFGLTIGFYDGFFGPGTGSFWAIGYVALLGFEFTRATAWTKVMNFTSNFTALVFFALGRNVILLPGLVMGAGQVLGAVAGSRMVVRRGARFVRAFFLIAVAATILRLIYQTYFR